MSKHMQVIRKHFEDLAYVSVEGENSAVQHLVVYTDSKADREVLMVNLRTSYDKRCIIIVYLVHCFLIANHLA